MACGGYKGITAGTRDQLLHRQYNSAFSEVRKQRDLTHRIADQYIRLSTAAGTIRYLFVIFNIASFFVCTMSVFKERSAQAQAKLDTVLESIRAGEKLSKVDLSNCALTEIPPEIFSLGDSVELLNFGGNNISSIPEDIKQLTRLRILFFAGNQFETIPSVLGTLSSLYMLSFKSNKLSEVPADSLSPSVCWLILTDNNIETLPDTIGQLPGLKKCMLAGNKLTTLPESMSNCKEIELLRIAANNIVHLPEWLLRLPKLSWLGFGGNKLWNEYKPVERESLPSISWNDLQVGDLLGEGASGFVYRAVCREPIPGVESADIVALKIFKGEATSDGLPEDEMRACESAGAHSSCVQVLGRLVDTPDGRPGLVLRLVPDFYSVLGGPPSFTSVTRDVYPETRTFSIPGILCIAQKISSCCCHLHKRGISHGDLYAHNILLNYGDICEHPDPDATIAGEENLSKERALHSAPLLSDFGAAAFYPAHAEDVESSILERIEVRAWGCLLEDLLTHKGETKSSVDETVVSTLKELLSMCMKSDPLERPSFLDITNTLGSLREQYDREQ